MLDCAETEERRGEKQGAEPDGAQYERRRSGARLLVGRVDNHFVAVQRDRRDAYGGHEYRGRLEAGHQFARNQSCVLFVCNISCLLASLGLRRTLVGNSPSCHIFVEISINEAGIVNTHSNRSEPAKLTMKMFLGDKTCGLRITFGGSQSKGANGAGQFDCEAKFEPRSWDERLTIKQISRLLTNPKPISAE